MDKDFTKHPCFSDTARHKYGRIHLPVAPRCNIQCNYCSRDFDCVNESRPGVTTGIMTPEQALVYLDEMLIKAPKIKVVGIAGPGDPFANPEETMKTLRLVREKYPEMILCVATNGMNLVPYVDELKKLEVSHVTITMNGVDPEITQKIYSWYRPGKRVVAGGEGAEELLKRQFEGITALKKAGVTVKINTVIIPGVNDDHAEKVAARVKELGADIMNCIPMYKTPGTKFAGVEPPSPEKMAEIRSVTEKYMPMMRHCARCRADAAGMIGEKMGEAQISALNKALGTQSAVIAELKNERPYVGAASREGLLINLHLGEAEEIMIFGKDGDGGIKLIEKRKTPANGGGVMRWKELGESLRDVAALLVYSAGTSPVNALKAMHIDVLKIEGLVEEAVEAVLYGKDISKMTVKSQPRCGQTCSGTGGGCG